ncbi:MAG: hypothetical protein Q9171_006536 [Xanthocarpia ochracea]
MEKDPGFVAAVEEARLGDQEGGIPIGACLVSRDGIILGRGHNMRVQKGSATLHVGYNDPVPQNDIESDWTLRRFKAEISALEHTGRLQAAAYRGATMYTTLSPCDMCTGACVMYKVGRVVIGENQSLIGGEEYLKQRGIEVVVLENKDCISMMQKYIDENPKVWHEDIGVQDGRM